MIRRVPQAESGGLTHLDGRPTRSRAGPCNSCNSCNSCLERGKVCNAGSGLVAIRAIRVTTFLRERSIFGSCMTGSAIPVCLQPTMLGAPVMLSIYPDIARFQRKRSITSQPSQSSPRWESTAASWGQPPLVRFAPPADTAAKRKARDASPKHDFRRLETKVAETVRSRLSSSSRARSPVRTPPLRLAPERPNKRGYARDQSGKCDQVRRDKAHGFNSFAHR